MAATECICTRIPKRITHSIAPFRSTWTGRQRDPDLSLALPACYCALPPRKIIFVTIESLSIYCNNQVSVNQNDEIRIMIHYKMINVKDQKQFALITRSVRIAFLCGIPLFLLLSFTSRERKKGNGRQP